MSSSALDCHGWHGFRRGLASNLNRWGVDDSVIQRILRHSTVAVTENHYIKTASSNAVAAMRRFSDAFSNCSPLVLQNVEQDVRENNSVRTSGAHVSLALRVSLAEHAVWR